MKDLLIGSGLVMPAESVTETFAILANRGKGKSNCATVMVEEMYEAGLPVVVLDIKGDWWGLRSSADGKGPGLPFVIFGGDHPDVPLEPTAGTLLADLIVDQRINAVLDLSGMSKTKARQFTVDFAERLYQRNRDAIHLVVEEADVLIPQRATAETARLLGAMEDIAKRGRSKGIGMTVVTQRPQEVAKSVLELMETVILLGMTGVRSIAAIKDWISVHADDVNTDVILSLPTLQVGEAWVWSPAFLRILTRVQIRLAHTFDSHATPKPGEIRTQPKGHADVDLAALGEAIAATVEKAKADDPRVLKARIADLERQVAAKPAPQTERVEVPVFTEAQMGALRDITGRAERAVAELSGSLAGIAIVLSKPPPPRAQPEGPRRPPNKPPQAPGYAHVAPPPRIAADAVSFTEPLPKAQKAVLTALAMYAPGTRTVNQVALLTEYSSKGGGFRNTLSALRSAGWIVGAGALAITEEGLDRLGSFEPLPSGEELRDYWCTRSPLLGKAHRAILTALCASYPEPLTLDELGDTTGYESTGGGFRNALSKLRSLELIEGRNPVYASKDMFA